MKFKPDLLICPKCLGANKRTRLRLHDAALACDACDTCYPLQHGMPNLLPDPTLRTRLEDIDYDQVHHVTEARRIRTYEDWSEILDSLSIASNCVLEIGSGTGQLTWGLMHLGKFEEVHATDVSGTFLRSIVRNYEPLAKNRTHYYICDANRLPFQSASFDVVVGHSVLHHFLDYQDTLAAVLEILRPGGYAVFYEPIIQGKVILAFFLSLIQKLDKGFQLEALTGLEHKRISAMVKHLTKAKVTQGDKLKLEKMEDKYIFDLNELKSLAVRLGFSAFDFRSYKTLDPSFKSYLAFQWHLMGLDKRKLDQYQDLFDAFGETVGALIGNTLSSPMGYLIFRK